MCVATICKFQRSKQFCKRFLNISIKFHSEEKSKATTIDDTQQIYDGEFGIPTSHSPKYLDYIHTAKSKINLAHQLNYCPKTEK